MLDDESRDPKDVKKQAVLGAFIFAILVITMLWGAAAFVEWISGHHNPLL